MWGLYQDDKHDEAILIATFDDMAGAAEAMVSMHELSKEGVVIYGSWAIDVDLLVIKELPSYDPKLLKVREELSNENFVFKVGGQSFRCEGDGIHGCGCNVFHEEMVNLPGGGFIRAYVCNACGEAYQASDVKESADV